MEKVSYALGLSIGNNLIGSGITGVNLDKFVQGVQDVLEQKTAEISYDEAKIVLDEYFQDLANKMQALNKQIGAEFLAQNKQKEGVIELASGLQYQVLTAGTGAKPSATDQVQCHYHGTMLDGQVFDSSVQRGEPAVFGVNQVIAGWVEALQLMQEGAKWRLFIPYQLAYGERGAGQSIPPFATLIFDVELLKVIK
ncbi:MAG: FKBP-type peptidyl-prolyl cis-trans isomerase [Paludibacteraceae bacterium]|jgi:FKBP-type peptidyl-prolyl cis-trans isomerase FklB|nr:FKBP-type peptidyl-prolyl cis-trans isomerase [Paludibacteraceae bacterium]MBP6437322.1 FKBP-type peptidyl-prolyl cis-trans isomerase [Paludibacteraceae bacterium]NLK91687.1 FKBP-type peptidyl-prolyl cis-trans isomerase [Bacteroidales bacterium]HOR40431.1 FKBP-type peptidyl-prolyl cis-trans isomerase [Paludibacteraceae bacterium]HPL94838.1 FKBP-type peptidyl-prolyl cis-trans isomerase [Paludibacteraceae bacterium]